MSEPIRLEELLTELEALGDGSDVGEHGWTAAELARIWGIGRSRVLDVLAEAKEQGLLVVSRKRVEAIDGRMSDRPAYRIRREASQGGDNNGDDSRPE